SLCFVEPSERDGIPLTCPEHDAICRKLREIADEGQARGFLRFLCKQETARAEALSRCHVGCSGFFRIQIRLLENRTPQLLLRSQQHRASFARRKKQVPASVQNGKASDGAR